MSGRSQRTNGKGLRAGLKGKQSGALFQKPRLRHPRGGKGRRVLSQSKDAADHGRRSERRDRAADRPRILQLAFL